MSKIEKTKTEKSTIEQLRDIRDKVSMETKDMTFEQLKKYVDEHLQSQSLHGKREWK